MMKIKEYRREYYIKNIEAIKQNRKEKVYCKCCDIYFCKYNIKRHLNSWTHSYFNK
jgi:hypothetical protein